MSTFNLGIRAHDLVASTPAELVTKLKTYQLKNIHFAPKKSFPNLVPDLSKLTEETARFLGDTFAQEEVKLSVLGCYVNISSRDKKIRQQAVDQFKHHLQLAAAFHAPLVGTETGSVTQGYTVENFTEEAYVAARESVIEMVKTAENLQVMVGIEAGLNHPLYTSQLAKRLVEEVQSPNLRIIFDPANLMRPDNYLQQERVIAEALEDLQDVIEVVHLKDFQVIDNKIKIVPVGTGRMDYTEVLRFLKHQRPAMFASLEATTEDHLPYALEVLRRHYDVL